MTTATTTCSQPCDRDAFLGARLALNDVQDTAVLLGVLTDLRDGVAGARIEGERRIGENCRLVVEAQVFLEDEPTNPASQFVRDDFLTLTLSRFF